MFRAEFPSVTAAQELRLSALESRPTDVTAFAVALARVALRVIALEAELVSADATCDKADSAAHVFDDSLPPSAVTILLMKILIPAILYRLIAILWSSLAHENIDMALVIKFS